MEAQNEKLLDFWVLKVVSFSPPVSSRLPHRGDTNHDHEYDGDDVGDYVCREPCVRHFSSLRRQKDQTEIRAYNEE